ncbi:hypothetical protein Pryu01_03007 [Paraliobacillus ryukyuensis]|uniref:Uncharacterized protein n=1 Tax=Paraliobacillus ryukyuensis TaxID=200904 RepID=A0A366DPN1_9BACI|nr:hypothetical protein [Paraliobacillus ryukyuensis]RBO92061.1 hypothetical protein DES48_11725 [Paraliobacillus ryukyuensis]
MPSLTELKPYEVFEYSWGTAVKHRNGDWEKIFLKPNGQEIDVTNLNVILRDNGIEFFADIAER